MLEVTGVDPNEKYCNFTMTSCGSWTQLSFILVTGAWKQSQRFLLQQALRGKTAQIVCYIEPSPHQVILSCRSEGKTSHRGTLGWRHMLFGHQKCEMQEKNRQATLNQLSVNVNSRQFHQNSLLRTSERNTIVGLHCFSLLLHLKMHFFGSKAVQRTHELWSNSPMSHPLPCFWTCVWYVQNKCLKGECSRRWRGARIQETVNQ